MTKMISLKEAKNLKVGDFVMFNAEKCVVERINVKRGREGTTLWLKVVDGIMTYFANHRTICKNQYYWYNTEFETFEEYLAPQK
tara:strand:+ start:53 stop:304 length:252 start_codon:yes stop_codon:yes gene_type:complete